MNTIIVDDEPRARSVLKHLLGEFCPEVKVIGEANSIKATLELLKESKVELVLLDIQLPQENGFKLFEYHQQPDFKTIFTTAYSKYSLMALKLSAIDYLLKPINKKELIEAIQKAKSEIDKERLFNNINALKKLIGSNFKKLPLPIANGYNYVNIENIIACEANRNYTNFYLVDGKEILVSKNLKTYESILENASFMRISRSYIINLNFVESYLRTNGGEVLMSNQLTIPISANLKKGLIEKLSSL